MPGLSEISLETKQGAAGARCGGSAGGQSLQRYFLPPVMEGMTIPNAQHEVVFLGKTVSWEKRGF